MSKLFDRIQEIKIYYGLSSKEFCKKMEFGYTTYLNYESGYRDVNNLELVEKVLNAFTNVSAEWLLRGDGEMLRDMRYAKEVSTEATFELINKMREEMMDLSRENGRLTEKIQSLAKRSRSKKNISQSLYSPIAADAIKSYERVKGKKEK
jgi:hypothetical protein